MRHLSIWWYPAVIYFWSYRQICQINYDIIIPLPAHRAILRRARQEELQQLQNVPVVPTRLRRGELRGRAGPPHPVLPRRLRKPSAPIQSQHQLRGLLLHHAEAFKQGEQVHRLPRFLGVKRKKHDGHRVRWVCFCGCVRCVVVRKREDACGCVCICVETVLNDRGSVWHLQLLTKLKHVQNNADKYEPILYFSTLFHIKKHLSLS